MAFSGGVDSSFLLQIAKDVIGKNVIAVTAVSRMQPRREITEAKQTAQRLGVKHMTIRTDPLKESAIRSNLTNRCYHCKLLLLTQLKKIAKKNNYVVIEATNKSDLRYHRPGIKAVKRLGVASPLVQAGFRKEEIRQAARRLGLPNWNKPSMACLASRIPYGQEITAQKMRRIEKAEAYLRRCQFTQIRVRDHYPMARIEVNTSELEKMLKQRKRIVRYLRGLGYIYVTLDLAGYRTGSLDL